MLRLHVVNLTDGVRVLDRAASMSDFDVDDHEHSSLAALTRHLDDSALLTDIRTSVSLAQHDAVLDWLGQRITVVCQHPSGPSLLVELWPDQDVPRGAVKDRQLDPAHVDPIHRLVAHIEAQLALPWPPRDPRMSPTGSMKAGA